MAIWSKGGDETNRLVHEFTVGDDALYDRVLAPYDILGSLAHARMLASVGLLTAADAAALESGLRALHTEFLAGQWTVETADEDVHSKVEALLTERIGEPARRLHTGRSRNDQVLTAIRLWQKHALCQLARDACTAASALVERARTHEFHPFPGYTHLQRAMPSSLGQFFGAHAQALVDDLVLVEAVHRLADCNPLGSGASYGVGLPLDRAMTADLLGFAEPGGIAMADANSRGKVESACLDAAGALVGDLSRFAADMVLFTTSECGFFTIGAGFTTGSSIMPQKKNLDLFELLRGRASRFLGLRTALAATTIGLPSGYSRDLQDTKALCIDGLRLARQSLAVVAAAAPTLQPVRERILAALTPDIYATDEAYRLVREQGMAFRDAYRQVGNDLSQLQAPDHDRVVRSRTHLGSTGNLGLVQLGERIAAADRAWSTRGDRLEATWQRLLGA
ncbi:MAG: argininosuccinate lyase [Planctomycetes bacterium]|nr:argininosuccinate lyase [Planctomycetota bacterium]